MKATESKAKLPGASSGLLPAGLFGNRWFLYAVLLLVLGVAAYFRFARLGLCAYRADEINFLFMIGRPDLKTGDFFSRWMELMGITGQFPFAMAFTNWFLDVFGLPPNELTLRLPSASWGVVAVGFAFVLGRQLNGWRTGLVLALLLALNPYHVQMSREAYYYAPLLTGTFVYIWITLRTIDEVVERRKLGWVDLAAHAAGFFLLTYSQPTGWPMAFLLVLINLGLPLRYIRNSKPAAQVFVSLAAIYVVLGLPLLFSDWALKHLMLNASGAAKENALRALAVSTETAWSLTYRALTSFAWGETPVRAAFTFAVLALGILAVQKMWRGVRGIRLVPVLVVGVFVLFLISRAKTGAMFEMRYIVVLLPVYLAVLALGITRGGEVLAASPNLAKVRSVTFPLLLITGIALGAQPCWWVTQLTGNPTPYKMITKWTDENLPRGTPVLVDRWFEPWNELRATPSTNVLFTYTIPNEPVETYVKEKWRDTARMFFNQFPDAAYLEIAKSYWEVPGVGTWDWPRQFFTRHVVITNEAGLKLRETGLAARGDYYTATTNRLKVEIFYTPREDWLPKLAANNITLFCFFGPGWEFNKTQDHRSWRILGQQAELHVVNLAQEPVHGRLSIQAASAMASKSIEVMPGLRHTFPAGQLSEWTTPVMKFMPGTNILPLRDPLWGVAQSPLLVSYAMAKPATEEEAAGEPIIAPKQAP